MALAGEMKRREKQPEECLEILAPHNHVLSDEIRYVKILAYTDLNRFEEIIPLIRMTVDYKPNGRFVPQILNQLVIIYSIIDHLF